MSDSWQDKIAEFDNEKSLAANEVLGFFEKNRETIMALARVRFINGFDKYGTTIYSKLGEQLGRETMEELADAIVYLAVRRINTAHAKQKEAERKRAKR